MQKAFVSAVYSTGPTLTTTRRMLPPFPGRYMSFEMFETLRVALAENTEVLEGSILQWQVRTHGAARLRHSAVPALAQMFLSCPPVAPSRSCRSSLMACPTCTAYQEASAINSNNICNFNVQ